MEKEVKLSTRNNLIFVGNPNKSTQENPLSQNYDNSQLNSAKLQSTVLTCRYQPCIKSNNEQLKKEIKKTIPKDQEGIPKE